jgi:hypothetical protein
VLHFSFQKNSTLKRVICEIRVVNEMANDDGGGDDFGQDCDELCGAQKYDFQKYISVDRDVATSGVLTVEGLCKACGSTRSVEERNKEDENEQEMVPSFAETYEPLKKGRAFSMRTV